jgi:hypothetical protein
MLSSKEDFLDIFCAILFFTNRNKNLSLKKRKRKTSCHLPKKTQNFVTLILVKNVKKSKRGCVVTCDKDGAKPQQKTRFRFGKNLILKGFFLQFDIL